jgi:hypothetical protein
LNLSVLSHYVATQPPLKIDPGGPVESRYGLIHAAQTVAQGFQASFLKPGSTVSINPQPLPPKELLQSSYLNPGVLVGLNPQPLPPEPPPTEVANLWENSAVLSSRDATTIPFYHGPTPDPAPWTAGQWLR